jgi:signal transduction histidine kinase
MLQSGTPEANPPGTLFFKQLHPEDLPAVVEALQRAAESSRPEVVEARIRRGKEERVLEIRADVRNGTAKLPALVGSVQDVTERKRTQNALARAKEFFEAVVDAMPVNLAILDGSANIISVNTAWRKFALANGYQGKRLGLGANYLKVCGSDSARTEVEAQIVARALRQMLNGRKEELTLEYPCHSSREQRWFMLRLTPFTFGGEPRIVAAHLNVTRLKRTEKSLEEAREMLLAHASELERRIDKRTMELKETIRSLEGVLYHVAHDLRAPLRAMEGFTTLLLRGYASQFDPAARDYADRIAVSAKRMDALIGDLLNFGRVCVVDMPRAFLNLGRIIDQVLKRHWQSIEASGAEIEVFRPMPKVWANEWAVGEAFYQLVSNSLKFARPEVPPRIRIWSEAVGASARIWIQDNGIGIPGQYAERVFRMFERLDEGTGSTGIGLAIVRKAVERMDGRVGVESAPAEGARFWLELPGNPQMP